jgi:hypothetical protein
MARNDQKMTKTYYSLPILGRILAQLPKNKKHFPGREEGEKGKDFPQWSLRVGSS